MSGPNDFTGQNIQDTYQRVLQISSSGQVTDGTGSLAPVLQVTASHAISASVEVLKEVSSSYAETASMASDSFLVQGDITASGDISASGNIITNNLEVNGDITASGIIDASPSKIFLGDKDANIAGRVILLDQTQTTALQINMQTGAHIVANTDKFEITDTPGNNSTQVHVKGAITASGNISASGNFIGTEITASGDISASGAVAAQSFAMEPVGMFIRDNSINGDGSHILLSHGAHILGNVTASGDISASGDIHASNFILPANGTIAPSTNNQTIKFTTKPPGAAENGEMLTIGPDLIEAKGSSANAALSSMLKLASPDGGQRVITFNDDSEDIDFSIKSDNAIAFKLDAATDMMAFRNHVGIGNSANKWPTDNYGLAGTPTYQLMVMGKTNLTGSVEIEGPLTASGTISSSGIISANSYNVDGLAVLNSADNEFRIGGAGNAVGAKFGKHDGTIRKYSFDGNITASGDISASGGLFSTVDINNTEILKSVGIGGTNFLVFGDTTFGHVVSQGGSSIAFTAQHSSSFNNGVDPSVGEVVTIDHVSGDITSSGAISASGIVNANEIEAGSQRVATFDGIKLRVLEPTVPAVISSANLTLNAPVTASSDISASGDMYASKFRFTNANNNDYIGLINGDVVIKSKTTSVNIIGNLTASMNISASGTVTSKYREYVNDSTVNVSGGDIITIGTGPNGVNGDIIAGGLYCMDSENQWELADANVSSTSIGMLGIAIESGTPTFLLKGVIYHGNYSFGSVGDPLYISESPGLTTGTAPTTAGAYVRIIGYKIDQTSRGIFFDPDKTWVELT